MKGFLGIADVERPADGDVLVWSEARGLYVPGPYRASIVTKTSAYTATARDYTILCNASSAPFTILLPPVALSVGLLLEIKKIDAVANAVTVDAFGPEAIDLEATRVLYTQFASMTIHCNGAMWYIL